MSTLGGGWNLEYNPIVHVLCAAYEVFLVNVKKQCVETSITAWIRLFEQRLLPEMGCERVLLHM